MDSRTLAYRFVGALSSMRTGLFLFLAVALGSVAGSLVPEWGPIVYGSWGFAVLIAALVLNTGFCTLKQVPKALLGNARTRVLFVVHLSVLVLALGCFWGAFAFSSTMVTVKPGDTFSVGGQSWTLDGVKVERYADGSVSDWTSSVKTPEGPRTIRVNHPAEVGDDKVLQSGYSREFRVRLEADGQNAVLTLPQDTETALTTDGKVGLALSPPQDGLLAAAQDSPDLRRTVDVLLTSGGRIVQKTAAFEGLPLQLGDTGLTVTVEASVPRSTFLVRHTPGLGVVWAGLALLALSVTALMLLPRRPPQENAHG